MGNIGAADVSFTLAVLPLFIVPQRIQGFATDDITDVPTIRSVEVLMGVYGVLSSGFVNVQQEQHLALQADSASNAVFETWWTQMQATKTTYSATGFLSVPQIGKGWVFTNGSLTGYKPIPPIKKLLGSRIFGMTWEKIVPVPL